MSRQAALQAGRALASADVTSADGGFHEEHLELLDHEVSEVRRVFGGEDGEVLAEGEEV